MTQVSVHEVHERVGSWFLGVYSPCCVEHDNGLSISTGLEVIFQSHGRLGGCGFVDAIRCNWWYKDDNCFKASPQQHKVGTLGNSCCFKFYELSDEDREDFFAMCALAGGAREI